MHEWCAEPAVSTAQKLHAAARSLTHWWGVQSQVSAQLQERHTRKAALTALHQQEDIDESFRNTAATLRELEVPWRL